MGNRSIFLWTLLVLLGGALLSGVFTGCKPKGDDEDLLGRWACTGAEVVVKSEVTEEYSANFPLYSPDPASAKKGLPVEACRQLVVVMDMVTGSMLESTLGSMVKSMECKPKGELQLVLQEGSQELRLGGVYLFDREVRQFSILKLAEAADSRARAVFAEVCFDYEQPSSNALLLSYPSTKLRVLAVKAGAAPQVRDNILAGLKKFKLVPPAAVLEDEATRKYLDDLMAYYVSHIKDFRVVYAMQK